MGDTRRVDVGRLQGLALAGLAVVVALLTVWASAVPDPPRAFGLPFGGPVVSSVPADDDVGRPTSQEAARPFRVNGLDDGVLGAVIGWTAVAVLAALLLLLLWRAVRALLRALAPDSTVEEDDTAAPDLARVAAALTSDAPERHAALGRGGPAEGVIAAWERLEETLRATGIALPASRTSTETALGVLRRFAVDESALQSLAGLYREAAWSQHALTEDHRAAAGAALARLDADLAASLTPGKAGTRA